MSTSIFDWLNLVAQNLWLYGGAFLLVLSILVFVHEWGHYIVARMCGVKIESFSIGFGKELFGFTDKRGTRWKFSLVPLGGYVKMFGDVDPASARHEENVKDAETQELRPLSAQERAVAFYTQPVWQRAAIVFAGPAINFLFAILILAVLFVFYGQPVTPPIASAVMGGSAAERAGFEPHDEILEIDGKPIRRFEDIRRAVMVGLDMERQVLLRRDGALVELSVTPEKKSETDHFGFRHSRGLLGLIGPGNALSLSHVAFVNGQATDGDADTARRLLLASMDKPTTIQFAGTEEKEGDVLKIHPLSAFNQGLTNPEDPTYGHLYIAQGTREILVKHTPLEGVGEAVRETGEITTSTLEALWQMITGTRSARELGGIIRIGAFAGDMAKSGFIALVTFTALLSINLGLINLFPIPMLDGGHLVFYAVETVKGSPISEQIQEYAFRLGLALLVGIMVFANLNDILQLALHKG